MVGNHVECSARTREIFGFDDSQGHGADDFFNRIVPADRERVMQEIRTAFPAERRLNTEYRIQMPNGALRNIVSSSVCHSDVGGALVRHVGVFSDATARKQTEEKLREADRRKDEFLAMLAHELRNPLAPITMSAEILSRPGIDQKTLAVNLPCFFRCSMAPRSMPRPCLRRAWQARCRRCTSWWLMTMLTPPPQWPCC